MRDWAAGLLLVSVLAGCSSIPKPLQQEAAKSTEIIQVVQCEIRAALGVRHPENAFAGIKLELDGTTGLGTSQTSLSVANLPATQGTTTYSPTTFGYTTSVRRTAIFEFFIDLAAFAADPNIESKCAALPPTNGLGFADWLSAAIEASSANGRLLKTVDYKLEFTATRNIGGGIAFKTSFIEVKLDKPSAKFDNTNKLAISVVFKRPTDAVAFTTGSAFDDAVLELEANLDKLTEVKEL